MEPDSYLSKVERNTDLDIITMLNYNVCVCSVVSRIIADCEN